MKWKWHHYALAFLIIGALMAGVIVAIVLGTQQSSENSASGKEASGADADITAKTQECNSCQSRQRQKPARTRQVYPIWSGETPRKLSVHQNRVYCQRPGEFVIECYVPSGQQMQLLHTYNLNLILPEALEVGQDSCVLSGPFVVTSRHQMYRLDEEGGMSRVPGHINSLTITHVQDMEVLYARAQGGGYAEAFSILDANPVQCDGHAIIHLHVQGNTVWAATSQHGVYRNGQKCWEGKDTTSVYGLPGEDGFWLRYSAAQGQVEYMRHDQKVSALHVSTLFAWSDTHIAVATDDNVLVYQLQRQQFQRVHSWSEAGLTGLAWLNDKTLVLSDANRQLSARSI